MARLDSAGPGLGAGRGDGFVLYLEGPRDRGVLEAWGRGLLPGAARRVFAGSVILGGRQPARALEHFRSLGGSRCGMRGLCVLDRDDGDAPDPQDAGEPGLEFFTWPRRHIESYLLVVGAILRALRLSDELPRLERTLREHLPSERDEEAWRELDAKRLLAPGGPLPRALGVELRPASIARTMRPAELHADVLECFARLRRASGLPETEHLRRVR
jgi:hypothetical protein